jgi:glycosyltransferase involved in cell wall biosynthesis
MSGMDDKKVKARNVIPTCRSQFLQTTRESAPNRRPKVLFLARPFPPLQAPGCARTWGMAKYLSRLGWEVTVVTPQPSVWRYVENPQGIDAQQKKEGVRRILTDHQWRCLMPDFLNCRNQGLSWVIGGVARRAAQHFGIDTGIGWIKAAERACINLTATDVDVILATGSPFAAFTVAKHLSTRLGCPYVLDYRDLWTTNPHALSPTRPATIQEEKRLLLDCAAVTTVSPSLGSIISQCFGLEEKIHVITNGYDPEELAEVQPYNFGHFAIVYTGTFYPPKRVISPVMAALKGLKELTRDRERNWYFHYYGGHASHVREEAKRFKVEDRVVLHGSVPRAEALSAICGAGIAVVITSVAEKPTVEDQGIVSAKVFEALGLGIPTLVVAPSGSDVELIVKPTGLAQIFSASEIDGMALFLQKKICGQKVQLRGSANLAWPTLAQTLASVLQTAIKNIADCRQQIRRVPLQ